MPEAITPLVIISKETILEQKFLLTEIACQNKYEIFSKAELKLL